MNSVYLPMSSPNAIQPHSPERGSYLDEKVKQIALVFFCAFLFCGGVFLSTPTISKEVLYVVALAISAGVIYWIITKSKNYDDPQEVLKFKEEAKSLSLEEIIALHGWKNMCKYEIPSQDEFEKKFNEHLENLPLKQAISFYEEVQNHLSVDGSSLKMPPTDVLERLFLDEQKRKEPCAFFCIYDIEKLDRLGILPQGWRRGYDDYRKLSTIYAEKRMQARSACEKETNEAIANFSSILSRAEKLTGLTPSSRGKIMQWVRELRFLRDNNIDFWPQSSAEILKSFDNKPSFISDELSEIYEEQQKFADKSKKALETMKKAINSSSKAFEVGIRGINQRLYQGTIPASLI